MIRLAILGSGGLGRGMLPMLPFRPHIQWVAMADSQGYAYQRGGLAAEDLASLATVADWPQLGVRTEQPVIDLLSRHGTDIDAVFMAMPNLPVGFYAEITRRIATQTPFQGVMVDALKRTSAVETLLGLHNLLKDHGILYVTGAGATPGLLTTLAAVAAQSFAKVTHVNIRFGVGIANWEAYRATVREDFLHLKGFDASRVMAMSDADITAELETRNGLLELIDMEHADDIILELAGVCPRDCVTVGGVVDTRNAKKPVSTTVTITGLTVRGETVSHTVSLADETTMTDNVCGTALGFITAAHQLRTNLGRALCGLRTSAGMLPQVTASQSVGIPA